MKILKTKNTRKRSTPTPRRRLTDRDDPPKVDESASANFRRNSTITGSRSGSVRSASELSGNLQSPRARAHHLRRRQRSLSVLFASSIFAAVVLVVLLYQFTAGVSTSIYGQVDGQTSTRPSQYSQAVQGYLNGRPLERIRVFLNHDRLADYLQQTGYTEVATIESIVPDGFGEAHVKLKVREPIASWTTDNAKRYVDRSGTIFARNYFQEPDVKIIDKSGVDIGDDASTVTSSRFLGFVGQAVGLLDDHGVDVQQVVIPTTGTRQVEFVVGGRDVIKMTVDRSAGEQSEDAAVAWRYLNRQNKPLKYIDVRVSGQAYYR